LIVRRTCVFRCSRMRVFEEEGEGKSFKTTSTTP
jgi:hypothetical protein